MTTGFGVPPTSISSTVTVTDTKVFFMENVASTDVLSYSAVSPMFARME